MKKDPAQKMPEGKESKLLLLLRQALRFLAVSGTGWVIDFGCFYLLTTYGHLIVAYANMLSSIPAITLVFLVSTRKIFANKKGGLPLWGKYAVYFLYQMVLVFCVSWVGEGLFRLLSRTALMNVSFITEHLKIVCKILITPITMTINFFVMKFLCEKI